MVNEPFDRGKLGILPLSQRLHKMTLSDVKNLNDPISVGEIGQNVREDLQTLARRIIKKRQKGGQVIWMMGAHVLRCGNSRFIIDLMKRGVITHLATNMAVAIHDFELSHIGATLEDVEAYIKEGHFGNWHETASYLNKAAVDGKRDGMGLGQAIGRMINLASSEEIPNKFVSIFNAAYELDIPVTVHKGIGYDITDQHPSADFGALGETSGKDFLIFAATISKLENGVFLNLGSAVMGPEVFLKSLSMARNVAHQHGEEIRHFTSAVFDIVALGDWKDEGDIVNYRLPGRLSDPRYYFRPLKSILTRTVRNGGESFYIHGNFNLTVPFFYHEIVNLI